MKKSVFIVVLMLTLTGAANAQLNKCIGTDGKVTFSDISCPTSAKSSETLKIQNTPSRYEPASPRAASRSEGYSTAPPTRGGASQVERELTGKIAGYLTNNDIGTASMLATTPEHFQMVAQAKRDVRNSELQYEANKRAEESAKRLAQPTVCTTTSKSSRYGGGSEYSTTTQCGKSGD